MLRGIYSSASGMIMEMDKVGMHASNISNAQSAGFKRRDMTAVPFKELMINIMQNQTSQKVGKRFIDSLSVPVGTGTASTFQEVDNTQGSLKPTSRALDIAIEGNGWLTMARQSDNASYTTRNGNFLLNDKGEIVNGVGDHLLDVNNKFITVDMPTKTTNGTKSIEQRLSFLENGKILDNGKEIATLRIQTDTDKMGYIPQLKLAVYDQTDAKKVTGTNAREFSLVDRNNKKISIRQGFIEESNVSIISEMIGLIHSSKNYESGHKLIMSEDKILDKAINELGRTG